MGDDVKFCQPHWDRLRQLVIDKGMESLISKSPEAAQSRVEEELEGVATAATYDPLLSAYWMLMARALEQGGDYLLCEKPGENLEYCPMCEVEAQGVKQFNKEGAAESWMDGCTDACLRYCRENNLLPRTQ